VIYNDSRLEVHSVNTKTQKDFTLVYKADEICVFDDVVCISEIKLGNLVETIEYFFILENYIYSTQW